MGVESEWLELRVHLPGVSGMSVLLLGGRLGTGLELQEVPALGQQLRGGEQGVIGRIGE